jgi:uncharacterized phiE125 gp8 family phage protein
MITKFNISSAPAVEPLSTSETKTFLKVDSSDEDTLIDTLIKASRQLIEREYDVALITQTLDFKFDDFPIIEHCNPDGAIIPLVRPIQSVTYIKYNDTDGNEQTWSSSLYTVDADDQREQARIVPAYDEEYPETRIEINAVTVRAVCGYGDAATDIPENIRLAMLMQIAFWYENREDMPLKMMGRTTRQLLNNEFLKVI